MEALGCCFEIGAFGRCEWYSDCQTVCFKIYEMVLLKDDLCFP
jgi:hypothetical protein